jgi:hypothetical protein
MRRAVALMLPLAMAACAPRMPADHELRYTVTPAIPPPSTWRAPGETADERRLREKLFAAFHAGACGAMPRGEAVNLAARIGARANVDDGMPMPRVRELASAAMARAYEDPDYRECSTIAVAQARALLRDDPPRPPAATATRRLPAQPAITSAPPKAATPATPRRKPDEIDI